MLNMLKPYGDDREKRLLQKYVNYMILDQEEPERRKKEYEEKLKICDILQADVDIEVNEELLEKAPSLKYILCTSVGIDYVDLEAATKRNVIVANNPDFCNVAVAEFTMALMYAGMRRIPKGIKEVQKNNWDARQYIEQKELFGKTLGLIGFGRIGREVARQAKGIGMNVQVRRSPSNAEAIKNCGVKPVSYDELLKTSNIISIHVPLNKDTLGIVGEREFDLMKSGTYLINVSRGGIVSESALLRNLRNGKLLGAALDVLVEEPPRSNNPLLGYEGDNLIITPHMAWFTSEASKKNDRYLERQVKDIVDNNALQSVVNK